MLKALSDSVTTGESGNMGKRFSILSETLSGFCEDPGRSRGFCDDSDVDPVLILLTSAATEF